jgi:hypothetical protein
LDRIAHGLGLDHADIVLAQLVRQRSAWRSVLLRSAEYSCSAPTRQLSPVTGVVAPQPEGAETSFEVRAFPAMTASPRISDWQPNAALAQW